MAYSRPVKCRVCGETFIRELTDYVKDGTNRYSHRACVEKRGAEAQAEVQAETQVYDYLKKIFKLQATIPTLHWQIQKFLQSGYTYQGIYKALTYWFDVKHNKPNLTDPNIGIVPYIYNEAHNFYADLLLAQAKNDAVPIIQEQETVWEVHIPPPQRHPKIRTQKLSIFGGDVL